MMIVINLDHGLKPGETENNIFGTWLLELKFGSGLLWGCKIGGPFGTVPELLFEKKQLIPALQQLIVSL